MPLTSEATRQYTILSWLQKYSFQKLSILAFLMAFENFKPKYLCCVAIFILVVAYSHHGRILFKMSCIKLIETIWFNSGEVPYFWLSIDRFRFRMYFSSFYRPMLLKEGASKMYLLNFWSFLKSLLQRSFKISLLLFADLIEAAFSFYNKWCKNFKGTQNSYSLQIYSLLMYKDSLKRNGVDLQAIIRDCKLIYFSGFLSNIQA